MGLNLDPDNAKIHEALLQEHLPELDKEQNPHKNLHVSSGKKSQPSGTET
jgi:hypothetical protein